MPSQIFISYARADNFVPVGSGAEYGFVSLLRANLAQRLASYDIAVWRDKEQIDDGEQFTAKILEGIAQSDIMLVVLTAASLRSAYCRQEFGAFAARWPALERSTRFIVILPTWLEPKTWPDEMQGQNAYRFYRSENDRDGAPETPMYGHDGKPAPAFYETVERLARFVRQRTAAPAVEPARSALEPSSTTATTTQPSRPVFVALPAPDMEPAYRRIVAELQYDGFRIVPDAALANATFVDTERALEGSEYAIHLLGREDDPADASTAAQLEATARYCERIAANCKRVIYAPKILVDTSDHTRALADRDPIAVRDRFGRGLTSDTIIGDGVNDFIAALKTILGKAAVAATLAERAPAKASGRVFLDFHPNDIAYAGALSKALRARGLQPRFAAIDDDRTTNKLTNYELLRASDIVVYCWANASDAWLYAEASEFDDWRKLGRSGPFAARAAVVGPPPRGSKALYSEVDPPGAVDLLLDLSTFEAPPPEKLDPLIRRLPTAS